MDKFRFTNWQVYKDAKTLTSIVIRVVKNLPKEYRFEIGSQLNRSSLSVVLNIAEGCGRSGDAELNRFINIAIGSLYETFAGIDVLNDNKLIIEKDFTEIRQLIDGIDNQLGGLKRKIKGQKI